MKRKDVHVKVSLLNMVYLKLPSASGVLSSAMNAKKVKANPTNECINLYEFKTEEALYKAVSDFAYVEYNYVRPHSYNNYATPHEARIAS